MKNCIYIFFLIVCALLSGCEKDGNDADTSYVQFHVSFVNTNSDTQQYHILFNGTEIENGTGFCKKNQSGILEVYNVGDKVPELKKEITIQGNDNIQLIKLHNTIDFYDEKDYDSFNVSISYMSGKENSYDIEFNGTTLTAGTNYCKKDENKGDVVVILKETKEVIFTFKNVTVSSQNGINILQLSENEFVQVPKDDEPNPESKRYSKFRFFYTADALPNVDAVKLIIYAYPANSLDEFQPVATLDEIKVNEFSKYVTLDYDYYKESKNENVGYCYDLINLETGEKIIDYNIDTDTYIPNTSSLAKQTFRIISGGRRMDIIYELSTSW